MQNFDDDELDELYQSLIFEHSKKPYNFKKISHCNCSQIGKNPSCGDKLEIFVNINQNKIQDISFIGDGCALSMASASFLMKKIEHLSLEEAKSIINKHPNPLAFYIYTASTANAKSWLQNIPAGGACINNSSWHLTNHHLPFGGRGFSGTGNYHGKYSFETFSHKKAVMQTPTWFDPSIKYPPLKGRLKLFKRIIK